MEEMNALPMWLNVFLGIAAALGGWEAIKYLLSLRANRRKDKAEAAQDAYRLNDKVKHNGHTWESLVDNNVWEPGSVGTESLWSQLD